MQGRNGEIIARTQVEEDGGLDMGGDNGSGKNRNTEVEMTCFSDGFSVRESGREEPRITLRFLF